MYEVKQTGEKFQSYFKAIEAAKKIGSEVLDDAGISRWHPAPAVSQKKLRMYAERKAAYAARESIKG